MSPDEVDPRALEPRHLAVVVPVVRDAVAACEHGGDIDAAGDRLARPVDVSRRAQGGAGAQQRLRGHTGPVGAFAADELALHDHRREPALHGAVGDVLAHGPAPMTMRSYARSLMPPR